MHINRLAGEKSPYLQQHAHNPVDWFPWGPEAFEKARAGNKPIFLSIGYSTCHWCHVMERESFENDAIAELLNRDFVSIKVDREERPDVDRIYMLFVQATTGGGGWPMSVFLTPDLKPFFGGTYFPPDSHYGRPGFRSILEQIGKAWAADRDRIQESSVEAANSLEQYARIEPRAGVLDIGVLDSTFYTFRRSFDTRLGGFGGAPKFPRPVVYNFLLRYHARARNGEALEMVSHTLREMAKGGMNDQLGGGFHRYSVDHRWFVPHFEKMLYDQAQIAISCLEVFQITRDDLFAGIARDVFEYVLRDMTHPDGAFYSAEDADSVIDLAQPNVKGEGAFYVWSKEEIAAVVDGAALDLFCYCYGVEEGGNVRDDPHGEFQGRNILNQAHSAEQASQKFRMTSEEVRLALAKARGALLESRARRVRPHRDDKILTSWNALMISAFAKGAQALGDRRYSAAARAALDFILRHMYDPATATLLRRFRQDEAAIPGFLDDYAFFANALVDFYETEFETDHLVHAVQIANRMRELFEDPEHGAFFTAAEGDRNLILRMKEDYDGAEPSGNSIATLVLLRLARITGREDFGNSAERALRAFSQRLSDSGSGVPQMLAALQYSLSAPRQVVIAGEPEAAGPLLAAVRRRFLPETSVLLADSEATRSVLAAYSPTLKDMKPLGGQPAAYVCENFTCQRPVTEVAELDDLLK